jgi:hypothetical protein
MKQVPENWNREKSGIDAFYYLLYPKYTSWQWLLT